MVRWCRVNLQCRGVLLIWIRVGQGPSTLAVGAGEGCLDIFSLVYLFSFLSPSLWESLGGLSLPRKSVVRLTDRSDMTLDVYRGRKTTKQQ